MGMVVSPANIHNAICQLLPAIQLRIIAEQDIPEEIGHVLTQPEFLIMGAQPRGVIPHILNQAVRPLDAVEDIVYLGRF